MTDTGTLTRLTGWQPCTASTAPDAHVWHHPRPGPTSAAGSLRPARYHRSPSGGYMGRVLTLPWRRSDSAVKLRQRLERDLREAAARGWIAPIPTRRRPL